MIPERTCVGCRQRRPQAALVRCVLTADGRAVVDRSGAGSRGVAVRPPPGTASSSRVRRKAFERAWRRPVGPDALAELGRQLGTLASRPTVRYVMTRKVE